MLTDKQKEQVRALDAAFGTMTMEMLEAINRNCVGHMRVLQAQKQAEAGRQFRFGDLVEFADRAGRKVRIRVEKINLKSLNGREVDGFKRPWRVAPSLCRLVGA